MGAERAAYRVSEEDVLDRVTKQTAATANRARATVAAARREDPWTLEPCDAATAPNSTGTCPRAIVRNLCAAFTA